MATVSVTLPSDGQTIDASDVNTPINTIVNEINGNLDADNIANGSITNAKLDTTAGELGGAWQSWTPSYTNVTVNSGTVVAKYTQVGKTVHARWQLTCAADTSIANDMRVTLPTDTASDYVAYTAIGTAIARDSSAANEIPGVVQIATAGSSADIEIRWADSEGSSLDSGVIPFAEAVNDVFSFSVTYEAA